MYPCLRRGDGGVCDLHNRQTDGEAHDRGSRRDAVLTAKGYTVLHVRAAEVLADIDVAAAAIAAAAMPLHQPVAGPPPRAGEATLRAHVSKGTYIRSLARDIARALGTVGHVTYLRRTRAGPFAESQAISLDLLNEIGKGARLEDHLLPLEAGLDGIPAHQLDPESAQAARQGRIVSGKALPHGLFLAMAGTVPVALMEADGTAAKVVRGFNLPDTAQKEDK
jgi:tRNA pseudouridine55 synthase